MLVKSVAGDFRVTAAARDPVSNGSGCANDVFTVLGERGGYLTNEIKITLDSVGAKKTTAQEGKPRDAIGAGVLRLGGFANC